MVRHRGKTARHGREGVARAVLAHVASDQRETTEHEVVVVRFGVQERGAAKHLRPRVDLVAQALRGLFAHLAYAADTLLE